ncbi:MAG: response regulator [Candidatus Marinimicrobia bacterium]|nr:response regulator [Candidatus Neomarinimicrobiota bacterium]
MKKIAVVEDNPDNLLLIEAILGSEYEIITFENGPDALAGLPDCQAELILLDIALPGMDGVTVLQEIRKIVQLKNLPVIALTAHAMMGDKEKYLGKGFDDYYSKPILDMDHFKDLVKSYMTPRQSVSGEG